MEKVANAKEQFYTVNDVMKLLGVKQSKAYDVMVKLKNEAVQDGLLYKGYPAGKIPKRLLEEKCMLEV